MNLIPRFQRNRRRGLGGREDVILRFLDKRRELIRTICETGAGVTGENHELVIRQEELEIGSCS